MQVGFVILSHASPHQLKRLIVGLDREYDCPPIACHHDFGQSPLDASEFGDNVCFVQPSIATGWAKWSVVQGALEAIKLLYQRSRPSWFVLLSAADYPIMRGDLVRKAMRESGCDAFIDARPLDPSHVPACTIKGTPNPKLDHFSSDINIRMKRRFYKSREFWLPIVRFKPKLRLGRLTFRPGCEARHPYHDWPCFYGDFWFCGNSKVAGILIEPKQKHLDLMRHLRRRSNPDETYFSTVLMNEPDLTVCLDNKRFAEWNGGGAHPMLLQDRQIKEMLQSGAFFARKFLPGSELPDRVDAALRVSMLPSE